MQIIPCAKCGKLFKPRQKVKRYCSRQCGYSMNGGRNWKPFTWRKDKHGYIIGTVSSGRGTTRYVKQHRYFMEQHLGRRLTRYEVIHHVNGIKDDNRIENLELTTQSKHMQTHHLKPGKTGIFGVLLDKRSGKYIAIITINRKRKQIGKFDTLTEAATAYQNKKNELESTTICP